MRPLTLPLAFAALTAAGGTSLHREDPRPFVILVHGRGLLGQDSAGLRREWKRDLDASLASVGLPSLSDDDVRMAWYADVLDAESDSGCAMASGGGTEALGLGAFTRGILASLTSGLPEQETRDARGLIGDLLYLVDPWKRCAAERRVGHTIEAATGENRPVIVVAYSLGSLVTYGYLSRPPNKKSGPLRFVTVGSPLGIREIRHLILEDQADRLALPAGVRSWVNIYDPDDPFSAPVGSGGEKADLRDQPTQARGNGDAHAVGRYLRDRSTGLALAQALCAAAKDRIGEPCVRLPAD